METVAEKGTDLLDTIAEFCRRAGCRRVHFRPAGRERRASSSRGLRDGARITPETLERVTGYLGTPRHHCSERAARACAS
jgi:hypothetical protein